MQQQLERGRPSDFQPRFVQKAYKLAQIGLTDVEIAAALDTTETTLNNWKTAHPEFAESLYKGKLGSDAKVANRLYKRATGWKDAAPDTTACIFWLKNRQPRYWRDKIDVEHGVSDELSELLGNLRKLRLKDGSEDGSVTDADYQVIDNAGETTE